MTNTESDTPESAPLKYNKCDEQSMSDPTSSGVRHIIVPSEAPTFTPPAARALLQLLLSVRRTRASNSKVQEHDS